MGLAGTRLEAVFLHFPVESRAADLQTLGDFGHVATVAAEGEADHVGLDLVERADVAVGGDGLARVGGGQHALSGVVSGRLGLVFIYFRFQYVGRSDSAAIT